MGVEEKRKSLTFSKKKKKEETNQRAYTVDKGYSGQKI